jgi:hypothetical protein
MTSQNSDLTTKEHNVPIINPELTTATLINVYIFVK